MNLAVFLFSINVLKALKGKCLRILEVAPVMLMTPYVTGSSATCVPLNT